jgi:hypothetical protein
MGRSAAKTHGQIADKPEVLYRYRMTKFAFVLALFSSVTFASTLPADYETWSGPAKRDFLWNDRILPNKYRFFEPTHFGTACKVALNTPVSMLSLFQSFNNPSDEVPKIFIFNRRKVIHPMGVVAKVRYRATGDLTGLLGDEDVVGLVRLSIAAPLLPGVPFTPGMALKLFVDGKPSVNTHAINSLDGQGRDMSFFRNPFNTELPAPRSPLLKAAAVWFSFYSKNPLRLGVEAFTSWTKNGNRVDNPSPLYSLSFEAPPETKTLYDQLISWYLPGTDFRTLLQRFRGPLVLFRVFARTAQGVQTQVGELVLEDSPVASSYSENNLFFNHTHSE